MISQQFVVDEALLEHPHLVAVERRNEVGIVLVELEREVDELLLFFFGGHFSDRDHNANLLYSSKDRSRIEDDVLSNDGLGLIHELSYGS